jgi:hypothetical protein
MQMPNKRTASWRTSHDDPSSGDSSSRDDDFMIAPHPRRAGDGAPTAGSGAPPVEMGGGRGTRVSMVGDQYGGEGGGAWADWERKIKENGPGPKK